MGVSKAEEKVARLARRRVPSPSASADELRVAPRAAAEAAHAEDVRGEWRLARAKT